MRGLILFEDGMEDSEGLSSRALLKRAAIMVDSVTTGTEKLIRTGYGLTVGVDKLYSEIDLNDYDFLIFPGGPYIAKIYNKETKVNEIINHFYDNKKLIAAICAAPRVIGFMGLLNGLEFTCYPGCEHDVVGGIHRPDLKVIVHENIITARASGYTVEFIYEVVKKIYDKNRADALLEHLAYY